MQIDLNDVGVVPVKLRGPDGVEGEVHLDLFDAYYAIIELARAHRDDDRAYVRAVADWLSSKGLPRPSLYAAEKFAERVLALVVELKKKDQEPSTPDSSASTGSTPTP